MLSWLLKHLQCSLWHHSHKHCLLLFQLSPRYKTCHPESINTEQDSFAFQSQGTASVCISGTTLCPALNKRYKTIRVQPVFCSPFWAQVGGAEKATGFRAVGAQVQSSVCHLAALMASQEQQKLWASVSSFVRDAIISTLQGCYEG